MRGKGGALALYADVNKNSHFQPVCALTDHSKHYAQHRGWTTLDYFDWSHFFFSPNAEPRRAETMRTNTIAGFWPLNVVFTFWVLRAYQCHVSSYHSQVSFVPLPIVCYLSFLPFLWEEEEKKKQARLCTLIKKTSSSLLERKRASRRAFACQPKHIFQSFRSLLHITSSLSLSWIGLFFYEMWLFSF